MICCIGLFAGLLLGQYLGVGPFLAPVGFIAGLAGDMTIFGLLGKRGGKKTQRIAQSVVFRLVQKQKQEEKTMSCCAPSRKEKKKKKRKGK